MSPYREAPTPPLACPRCTRPLPPGELAFCFDDCGIWVSAEAAPEVFEASELRPNRLGVSTRAWPKCPQCAEVMTAHGHDLGLFAGCPGHGFWVDRATIRSTGLGLLAAAPRVAKARAVIQAERDRIAAEERARAEQAAEEAAARERARAERAREEAAREAERQRRRKQREAAVAPYLELVRAAFVRGDPWPLAEKLQEMDARIAELMAARS